MLCQLGDLAEIRAAFFFRLIGRVVIDVQHDRAADKAESLEKDFLLVLSQLQIDCFVHSANFHDELLTAFPVESLATAASDAAA